MLLPLIVMLQLHSYALADRTMRPSLDSASKVVERARRAEEHFILEWRREWERNRSVHASGPRFASLHCHYDDWPHSMRLQLITTPFSNKSMCPIWYRADDSPPPDEAAGIDNGLRPEGRPPIRAKRATLLRLLDTAAAIAPDNPWIVGQRVRLYVDQRDFDRAQSVASADCQLSASYCAMLAGYVLFSRGDHVGADTTFARAVKVMSDAERCGYLNIGIFLNDDDRKAYDRLPCEAQSDIDRRFWWLADPLFVEPGNERLTIHLYRQTLAALHSVLNPDERFDWRLKYGGAAAAEMLLRYGWPAVSYWNPIEDNDHFGWLGYRDSSANASREYTLPRYHTTPTYAAALDLSRLGADDFADIAPKRAGSFESWDHDWWPIEHFARTGPLVPLGYQLAVFRRAHGALVAVSTEPRSDLIPASSAARYIAALIAMDGPADSPRRAVASLAERPREPTTLSMLTNPGVQVVGVEAVAPELDSSAAARARFVIDAPEGLDKFRAGELSISDAAIFSDADTTTSMPRSADEAIPRMLPSLDLRAHGRIGVFFEVYGMAPSEPAELTLQVVQEDRPGLLRRIGGRLGIADASQASVRLHWRDDQVGVSGNSSMVGGVPVQTRSVAVDLSQLKAGHYMVEIGVARPGQLPAVSRREVRILEN